MRTLNTLKSIFAVILSLFTMLLGTKPKDQRINLPHHDTAPTDEALPTRAKGKTPRHLRTKTSPNWLKLALRGTP